MNLDELRSVQSKERQKDSLQHLRPSFYQEVGEYIAELEDERDRVAERADDPFSSPEVGRLTDEIETAKDVVEAIYERRMGKLVKQSSLAAAGMPADDEGLTAEEADLFDDLVDRISSNKSRVLDVLEGVEPEAAAGPAGDSDAEPDAASPNSTPSGSAPADASSDPVADPDPVGSPSPTDATDDAPPVPPEEPPMDDGAMADADSPDSSAANDSNGSSGVTPADVMGGDGPDLETPESDPDPDSPPVPADDPASEPGARSDSDPESDSGSAPADAGDVDRVTVKITRDIGSILGVDDREYSLSSDDIVTLPEQNATPLLEQEAAEPLE